MFFQSVVVATQSLGTYATQYTETPHRGDGAGWSEEGQGQGQGQGQGRQGTEERKRERRLEERGKREERERYV